jgi:Fe2+ transport system protein FeoA
VKLALAELKIGQKATILDVNTEEIPLKLLEMGCLPGNTLHSEIHFTLILTIRMLRFA